MNENAIQDTALRNLLTHNLESDDMKKFIDSLNVSKDDDSAIQELKKSYEAYISNESLSAGGCCFLEGWYAKSYAAKLQTACHCD